MGSHRRRRICRSSGQQPWELKAYIKEELEKQNLQDAIYDYLDAITTVKSYDEEKLAQLKAYYLDYMDYYASSYGISADYMATYYGYADADSYAQFLGETYVKMDMIEDKVFKDSKVTVTDEDFDAYIQAQLEEAGTADTYTVEEIKESNGDDWTLLYKISAFKYDRMMELLEDRVVIIEDNQE